MRALLNLLILMLVSSCAYPDDYQKIHKPNYDQLVGRKFEEVIFMGRKHGYKSLRVIGEIEELENRRPDGCILVFGVRKIDDVIQYWRIDSFDNACLVVKKSFRS